MKRTFLNPILVTVLISCTNITVDQEAEAKKLMELSREWAKAALNRDAEKTISYWSDDAVIISPDVPVIKGYDAIRKMVEESLINPDFEIYWEPKEAFVSSSGDLGYVLGLNYVGDVDSLGNKIKVFGNSVEIWKKQDDGSWKTVVDIFNGDPTITSLK